MDDFHIAHLTSLLSIHHTLDLAVGFNVSYLIHHALEFALSLTRLSFLF